MNTPCSEINFSWQDAKPLIRVYEIIFQDEPTFKLYGIKFHLKQFLIVKL